MNENIVKALQYIYLSTKRAVDSNSIHGLRYKQGFQYLKQIRDISIAIENNQIPDLEEVLSYGG